jgi:hypothetical protein
VDGVAIGGDFLVVRSFFVVEGVLVIALLMMLL